MEKNKELAKLYADYLKDTGAVHSDAAAMLTLAHCVLELRNLISAGLKLMAGISLNTKSDPAFQTGAGPQNSQPPGGENAKEANMGQRKEGPQAPAGTGVLCPQENVGAAPLPAQVPGN